MQPCHNSCWFHPKEIKLFELGKVRGVPQGGILGLVMFLSHVQKWPTFSATDLEHHGEAWTPDLQIVWTNQI